MATKKSDISEKEKELINKVAEKLVDLNMGGAMIMILETIKPLSTIIGQLSLFYFAPFLPILDEKGYDFINTFKKRDNLNILIRIIENQNKDKENNFSTEKFE